MQFKHKENERAGMFYLEDEKSNDHAAEIVYSREDPDRVIIQHTEVSRSLRGKNIGNLLVEAVVEFARAQRLKVVPLCTFAGSVFRRNKDFADVLA